MTYLTYFARCAHNLARYGRRSDYVMHYGYAKTIANIAKAQVRSHWLAG